MRSILDVLTKANPLLADVRETLVKAREALAKQAAAYPDLAGWLDPQIANLDAKIAALDTPLDPAGLAALAATVLGELKQVGSLHFTTTPHAGSGI